MGRYKKLTLLHSNDMHGDFLAEQIDDTLVGGVSMLSGYISRVRAEEPNTLYCIAGDMFRGSVIDSEYQGISTIEIMNMLSPDVVGLGNHETDYGLAHLLFLEKCAQFPIINSNLYIKLNRARLFRPCLLREIDGMKILFIGILTEDVIAEGCEDRLISAFVNAGDAAEEIGRICNAYNAIDVDFTVLLTHIGFEEDKKLAARLDPAWGVDVIIGGHSHTLIDEPARVNGILIVQAGTGTDQIGRFDILVDTERNCVARYDWQCIPINADLCPADPKIETLLSAYKRKTDEKYGRVVTRFSRRLTHPARNAATDLGGLFADALKNSLGLDLMLLGSGSVRSPALGPIVTLSDLVECFPFDDAIHMFPLSGRQLRHMLRYMLRDEVFEGVHSEFYQLSDGMRVVYAKSEHEIRSLTLNGREIGPDSLLIAGMQHFHFLNMEKALDMPLSEIEKNGETRVISTSCREILEIYFQDHPHLDSHARARITIE